MLNSVLSPLATPEPASSPRVPPSVTGKSGFNFVASQFGCDAIKSKKLARSRTKFSPLTPSALPGARPWWACRSTPKSRDEDLAFDLPRHAHDHPACHGQLRITPRQPLMRSHVAPPSRSPKVAARITARITATSGLTQGHGLRRRPALRAWRSPHKSSNTETTTPDTQPARWHHRSMQPVH